MCYNLEKLSQSKNKSLKNTHKKVFWVKLKNNTLFGNLVSQLRFVMFLFQ